MHTGVHRHVKWDHRGMLLLLSLVLGHGLLHTFRGREECLGEVLHWLRAVPIAVESDRH